MRLTDLEPKFVKRTDIGMEVLESMQDAEGLWLLCPRCFQDKGGVRGVHSIICWRPSVPADVSPGPGRWEWRGTGVQDLTLFAGSSSIFLTGPGCGAHFFINSGAISFC